jgi:hypothetical protein
MSVTKDSFRDWKANPVTKAVMTEIARRIQAVQEDLGVTAGQEPLNDRFKSGAVGAYTDLLNIEFTEVNDGN